MSTSGAIGDLLSAGSLATFMSSSLPKDTPIKNAYEAIALAVHAGMIAVGFRLKGLGEDHQIPASSDSHDPQPLPAEWNASSSSYAFRYSHPQSSMEYILKVGRLGSKATVDAIATGDDKRTSFDIPVNDYVSEGNLPSTPVSSDSSVPEESKQKIQDIFISAGRLSDLGTLLKLKVIQKLAPGISKEGYEEVSDTTASSSRRRDPDETGEPDLREPQRPAYDPLRDPLRHDPPARPYPFTDPNAPRPDRGFPPGLEPPGFEDEYDILRQPGGRGPNRNPLSIGHDDLYPAGLGPHDPIYGGGIGPLRGGGIGSGGMHPTFDDPMFGGQGGAGRRGDPQVPGGARYDPVGPSDPRGGPRGFPGAGHRGGPPNPFGGFGSDDFI